MNCLWLTLADPDPATNGQLIYSQGLIEAISRAGVSLCVMGLERTEKPSHPHRARSIDWRLAKERRRGAWRRLSSPLPAIAQRGNFPEMQHLLDLALVERTWDAIVFDSICSGWALSRVTRHLQRGRQSTCLVYLAHNHEITVARHIADTAGGVRRVLKEIDHFKVERLERRLIAAADLVTANTPEDVSQFARDAGGRPVLLLPPGHSGTKAPSRTIDAVIPRRAILVGSNNWMPKRLALESFLAQGASLLARNGIELQIVGEAEPAYLARLKNDFPGVDFVGRVDDVRPYLKNARVALVPDVLGGFKLKGLDYVFNRVPILAMREALPGMPLENGKSVRLFESHGALAQGILGIIDNFPGLNAQQICAYDACIEHFDWSRIGNSLLKGIGEAARGSLDHRAGAVFSDLATTPQL